MDRDDDVLKKTSLLTNSSSTSTSQSVAIEEITLDDDDDDVETLNNQSTKPNLKCPNCQRDMTLWSNSRRSTHVDGCGKDAEEMKKKRKFTETIKKTTKNGKVDFLDEDSRKFRSPKKVVNENEKEWETTKDDVRFAKIDADEEANRRRKRPRSFAVVELAPRECQCEVLTTLHNRFIAKLCASRNFATDGKENENLSEQAVQMQKLILKNSRLEQLSIDMRKMMEDGAQSLNCEPITIKCLDGEVQCQRSILKHRTSVILKLVPSTSNTIVINQPREILRHWLVFVFSAQIEWSNEQNEKMKELAENYGPPDLLLLTSKIQKEIRSFKLRGAEKEVVEENKEGEMEERMEEEQKDEEGGEEDVAQNKNENENEPEKVELESAETVEEVEKITAEIQIPSEPTCSKPNVYMSDDPLIGFKVDKPEDSDDSFRTPKSTRRSAGFAKATNGRILADEEDSFDNFVPEVQNPTDFPSTSNSQHLEAPSPMDSFDIFEPADSTGETSKTPETRVVPRSCVEKLKFGSNVRVLKTNDITPMPDYEGMDENELKERVKAIGQRPRGKKKMIEILKMAYDTTHPVIVPDTPTLRPLLKSPGKLQPVEKKRKPLRFSPKKVVAATIPEEKETETEESDADKTLNMSDEGQQQFCGDVVMEEEEEEEEEGGIQSTGKLKDLETMKVAFLEWIRLEQNLELYNHLLSLHPVSLEELMARMGKADGIVSVIGKAKLAQILDSLAISFQVPQKGGARRAPRRRK